jgi:hypothetical protein
MKSQSQSELINAEREVDEAKVIVERQYDAIKRLAQLRIRSKENLR